MSDEQDFDPVDALAEDEDAYALDQDIVETILQAVEAQDQNQLIALLEPLHVADIADILEQISRSERAALIDLWGIERRFAALERRSTSTREPSSKIRSADYR